MAVSRTLSAQAGWKTGDEVSLRLSDTTALKLKVVAVLDASAGLPGALLPRDTLLDADPGLAAGRVYLALDEGADAAQVAGAADAVAREYGAAAFDRESWLERSAADSEREGRILVLVLLGMALLYTGIAIANTLVMAAEQRASGVLLLRRLGATGGQVLRSVLWETLTVVVVGGILGIAAAGVTVLGMSRALDGAGGASFPVPWAEMGGVLGGCLLIAMIASSSRPSSSSVPPGLPGRRRSHRLPARGCRRLPRRWSRRCTAAPDRRYIPRPASAERHAPPGPDPRGPGRAGPHFRSCPADLRGPATPGTHARRTPGSPRYVQYEGDPGAGTGRHRLFHEDPPDRTFRRELPKVAPAAALGEGGSASRRGWRVARRAPPLPTRSVPGRRAQFLPGAPPVASAAQVSRPRHRGTS